ncbi:hypothetical protein SAMN05216174_101492 [Actinokineospora iranica]|uniref:HTH cro/C1-type domain-containing protein n=1 Tax=Actinokineospora iranica TaxID=1271860 RepID=A0A1G6JNM5_9PSEU|nr:hypothetical protein SAMN05216174_101492 [Actinokineospora iranica]
MIIAYEEGTAQPTDAHLSTLADALTVTTAEFTGPPDADDSWEYWGLICAAMPPMTSEQIASVAVVLRRIDQQRQNADTRPDTARPEAA